MIVKMYHHKVSETIENKGVKSFLDDMRMMFPQLELERLHSLKFLDSKRYACAVKGKKGDLVILWR